jgi:hypothetical protein
VSAYSESGEEALRTRDLLRDWAGEGLLTQAQYERMEQETVCEFRRTNVFLRLVLYFFTLIIVGAAAALFFKLFLWLSDRQTQGVCLLIFAAIAYAATEFAVSRARLYRYGIEEALATCSVFFLCVGLSQAKPIGTDFPVSGAGAIASLWIWRRFGFPYAFLAAMIFVLRLPGHWTSSPSVEHFCVAAIYAAGLIGLASVRAQHRLTFRNDGYSIAEAFLWLGIYLAINLQLSSVNLQGSWWNGLRDTSEFSRPFYWTSWGLIWCLPLATLARGIRQKDRWVLAVGAITAILTLIANKPYLGWQRRTWDPMLLGVFLAGVALVLGRWLARGPGGVRYGFTALRLSGKDKRWMNTAAVGIGVISPHSITVSPQPDSSVHFGGGDSGGGGATSDF